MGTKKGKSVPPVFPVEIKVRSPVICASRAGLMAMTSVRRHERSTRRTTHILLHFTAVRRGKTAKSALCNCGDLANSIDSPRTISFPRISEIHIEIEVRSSVDTARCGKRRSKFEVKFFRLSEFASESRSALNRHNLRGRREG